MESSYVVSQRSDLHVAPLPVCPHSNVSEMVIFLFLGISLYDVTVHHWDWGLVLWTLFFAIIIRPIGGWVIVAVTFHAIGLPPQRLIHH